MVEAENEREIMLKLLRALLFGLAAAAGFTLVLRAFSGRRVSSFDAHGSEAPSTARDRAATNGPAPAGNPQDRARSQADLIDEMTAEHQQKLLDELNQHL